MDEEEPIVTLRRQAELAWVVLAAGIIAFEVVALESKKIETLSEALWRSLSKPTRWPISMGIWFGLTYHLFFNPAARDSYKMVPAGYKKRSKK